MKFKNRKLIWSFRLLAVIDVLFAKKFELKTYEGNRLSRKTSFDYNEVKNANL